MTKLYHYSSSFYTAIRTRRNQRICTPEQLEQGIVKAKRLGSPGSYHDHVSFFFDPLPLEKMGNIFRGLNPFWKNGNEIFEYVVDVSDLDKDIVFYISETPDEIRLLDNTEWVYTDEFREKYLIEQNIRMKKNGEIGQGLTNFLKQVSKYKGKTTHYYELASRRPTFEEEAMRYASCVPHAMLYPKSGAIHCESIQACVVGSSKRFPVEKTSESILARW